MPYTPVDVDDRTQPLGSRILDINQLGKKIGRQTNTIRKLIKKSPKSLPRSEIVFGQRVWLKREVNVWLEKNAKKLKKNAKDWGNFRSHMSNQQIASMALPREKEGMDCRRQRIHQGHQAGSEAGPLL